MTPKKASHQLPPSSPTHQDPPEGLPQKFSELSISDDDDGSVAPTSLPAVSTKPVVLPPQRKAGKKKEEPVIIDSWEDGVSDVSDGSEGDVVVVGPKGGRRWDDDSVDEFDDEGGAKDPDYTKVTSKPPQSPPLPPGPPPNTGASSLGSSASSSRKATPAPAPPRSSSWDSDPPLFTSPPSGLKSSYTIVEPEKKRQPTTDAVARRLIANALGIRAPKSTAEQKEYEASMKAQLKKKREKERAEREARKKEEEEVERMKREVWGGFNER